MKIIFIPINIAVAPAFLIMGNISFKYESFGGAPFKSKCTIRWWGMYLEPSDVITGGVDSSTTERQWNKLVLADSYWVTWYGKIINRDTNNRVLLSI